MGNIAPANSLVGVTANSSPFASDGDRVGNFTFARRLKCHVHYLLRIELDGAPLAVSLEQRSESTWRGFANARVSAGQHAVRATVVDEEGRTGGYRWTFEAGP